MFLAPDAARWPISGRPCGGGSRGRRSERDRDTLGLDPFQIRQVEERLREANETVDLRVAGTYQWVLNPTQSRDDPHWPGDLGRDPRVGI
ncbi:MAG: hypothetical protein M5T61_19995 [Acidimicrobiia bacterium]|nr:hypothetical protein [Acidimicrobiia bacterium]